jgi:hypothetical protein
MRNQEKENLSLGILPQIVTGLVERHVTSESY